MTNALDIFKLAMSLMDELNDAGEAENDDTIEYKNRTLGILNVLRGELYPYSDTYAVEEAHIRPIVGLIPDFETAIDLDDYICQSVMPYGLAAHLLLDENPSAAGFFQQRYDELKAFLMSGRGLPSETEDIYDVYASGHDGQSYLEFPNGGRW